MTQPKCVECKKGVKHTDKSGSVKCSQCDRWWHGLTCTTLNAEALKCLWDTYDAAGHHWWACEGCTQAYMTLTKRMNQWERDMANLKVTVVSNTELAKEANAKVDKVSKDVDEVVKSRKQDKADAVNEATKRMSAELLERGGKKNNAILYGLDEPPLSVKGVDRKNSDLALIKDMFKEMEVKPDTNKDIKFSFRLGELSDKVVEEPRPLCIGLQTTESRDHIFQKAKNLGKSQNFFAVSIVPDLTRMQREEDKGLMKEAERLNTEMTAEDKKNWNYRCIGKKGERQVVRMRVRQESGAAARGRGGPPPRHNPRQQGQRQNNSNLEPLGTRPLVYNNPPPPGTSSDLEESMVMYGFPTPAEQARHGNKRDASRSPSMSPGSPTSYRPRANQQTRFNKRGRANNLL